ncbi:MAG TPA: hypothetical protein VGX48_27120 [Pyrinomonadaceae bacterium]|jgi:hypothetical protein|nr:hypothetical protein [Pyrinomonadaceae bacterium]
MSDPEYKLTMAQWKEKAREVLRRWAAEMTNQGSSRVGEDGVLTRPKFKGKEVVFVFDPIKTSFDDGYGGMFTCTYDIRRTLENLSKRFQEIDFATKDEIEAYASSENISLDEAMAKLALRHVEAEIFSKLKAGQFLHDQLRPTLVDVIGELLDAAFLYGIKEYGFKLVEPAKIFEKLGRKHIKGLKQRSGLVPKPGRPTTWTREEVVKIVSIAMSKQKTLPTLRRTAEVMNYGGLSGGGDALRKLLEKHKINWREMKETWKIKKRN